MASTNQSPEYQYAEKKFMQAETDEEKLACLEEMIRYVPKHKAGEAMRANLKTRYKKLKQSLEKQKKAKKSHKPGIKKEHMQACIIGFPNSGKTSLFKLLTGQGHPSSIAFSTAEAEPGSFNYNDCNIQLIDMPAFPSHDKNILNSTDAIILIIESLNQLVEAEKFLPEKKRIIIYNKTDLLNEQEKRKLHATLESKKIPAILFSAITKENLEEIKNAIFESFPIIRIYLKEPKKPASTKPLILSPGSTVKDAAEKILKGFSKKIKRTKVTGPSAKFPEQIVGIEHVLKDKDIVEFQTA